MFERYTVTARRVVFRARYEASQYGSDFIECEHLLLGVMDEDRDLMERLLGGSAKLQVVRGRLVTHCQTGKPSNSTSVDMPLSHPGKRALVYANEESERLKQKEITQGHLVLGILREEGVFAAAVLRDQGLALSAAREVVAALEAPAQPAPVQDAPASEPLLGFTDLTEAARTGRLGPIVGRERELDCMLDILARRRRPNVLLVGEPGVGKTAILEGLAFRIAEGRVAQLSADRPVLAAPAATLLSAGADRRERISRYAASVNAIVCIEDLLDLPGRQPGWAAVDALHTILALAVEGVPCIATATPAAWSKAHILAGSFEVIPVAPATESETVAILNAVKTRYEQFHGVAYAEGAMETAVVCSRLFSHRFLPEAAIDVIDDAGARAQGDRARITSQEIVEAVAGRTGVPTSAVQLVLDLKKGKEPQAASEILAAVISPELCPWLPFLAAWLTTCSPEEAAKLAGAIREATTR